MSDVPRIVALELAVLIVVLSLAGCHRGKLRSFVWEIRAPQQRDFEGAYVVCKGKKTETKAFSGLENTERPLRFEVRGRCFTYALANNSNESVTFEVKVDGASLGKTEVRPGQSWRSTYREQ